VIDGSGRSRESEHQINEPAFRPDDTIGRSQNTGIAAWTAALGAIPDAVWPRLLDLLDTTERDRAARFVFERHRRQHIAAHALKRLMLSAVGGAPPRSWTFEAVAGGKPRVGPGPGPHFNISHCDGLVACAISDDLELGVDVEPVGRKAPLHLARTYFAPEEERWLASLPAAEQPLGFFRLWTLKEAYIKATGLGLAQPLHDFAFAFDPLRVLFHDPTLGDPRLWRFEQRLVGEHLLALAWRGDGRSRSVDFREVSLETLLSDASIGV